MPRGYVEKNVVVVPVNSVYPAVPSLSPLNPIIGSDNGGHIVNGEVWAIVHGVVRGDALI